MDKKGMSTCVVCGETSDQVNLHYSRLLCNGCRAFFKRTVQGKVKFSQCKLRGECKVNMASRKNCKPCRYNACLKAGVDKKKVQPAKDSTCVSPDKGSRKSVLKPTYEHHPDFCFQQPPFILPNFYGQVQHDLIYQTHDLHSSFNNRQMGSHATDVFPSPGNPVSATPSSYALFPPSPNAVISEIQRSNSNSDTQNLMPNGHPDPFQLALSQRQIAVQSRHMIHGHTSYVHGNTSNFHPSEVSQFQALAYSHHGTHGQMLTHGVFGSPLVYASHSTSHPIMPFPHSVDQPRTPITNNASPMLLVPNLHSSGKEARRDEEQTSNTSQLSERSSAFMIDSLLESGSESRSTESNPERSSTSVTIGHVPLLTEMTHGVYSRYNISAITGNDHGRSADDSGLHGDRLTSTPNFAENLSPESVEINVVECNTPSPIDATERDQQVQFDSGIDSKLHVSNGDPNSFQHLETSGKSMLKSPS